MINCIVLVVERDKIKTRGKRRCSGWGGWSLLACPELGGTLSGQNANIHSSMPITDSLLSCHLNRCPD